MPVYDKDGNQISTSTAISIEDMPPVPVYTVNAMLKCAYTYIEACRAGNLSYGDGTGVHQAEGKICCSTFLRQLLQGIPYSDYKPATATTTTASGKRWRYGYRMIGQDYYAEDATTTAQQMYDQFKLVGRAWECNADMIGAQAGDFVVFGSNINSITHIAMFVARDYTGAIYLLDASYYNSPLAVMVHENYRDTAVGIIRPNLTQAPFESETASLTVSNNTVSLVGQNGYSYFLSVGGNATANSSENINGVTTTPRYSGKDSRVIIVPFTSDTTKSVTVSGLGSPTVISSKYIIAV